MQNLETIEIKLSKPKSILMLIGCGLFVTAGINFVLSPEKFVSVIIHNRNIIFMVGCVGILFFGFMGLLILKKLIKNETALIISQEGITDKAGGASAGFIPWSDIIAVKEQVMANQRFINLVVRNPQEYIDRQKSSFKRKIMQKNHNIFGTGIGISTNNLKIGYGELKKILDERLLMTKNRRD